MKNKNRINAAFFPVFSGIKPTANMVLPTYLRQLQYLEGVLNQLIVEVEANFESFSEYTLAQLENIEAGVAEIIENVSYETIEITAEAAIQRQVQEFNSTIADLRHDITGLISVDDRQDSDIEGLSTKMDLVELELISLAEGLNDTLEAINQSAIATLSDAKGYTDSEVSIVSDRIDALGIDESAVGVIVDAKVEPLLTRVDKNEEDIVDLDSRMDDIEVLSSESPSALLLGRVNSLEIEDIAINSRIDGLDIPSTTALESDVEELKIKSQGNLESIGELTEDLGSLEVLQDGASADIVLIGERLTTLENRPVDQLLGERVDDLEDRQSGTDSEVATLNQFVDTYTNVDTIPDRLASVETDLANLGLGVDPLANKPIEFKKTSDGGLQQLKPVNTNDAGHITYSGRINVELSESDLSIKSTSSESFKDSLNKPDIYGKSVYGNKNFGLFTVNYKISGEEKSDDVIDVLIKSEQSGTGGNQVELNSDKLSTFVSKLRADNSDTLTDVVIVGNVYVELVFDGPFILE